jgi:hypothetical protein
VVDSQVAERLEFVSAENRLLKEENDRLSVANKALARQLIERNELVVALELEARAAKRRKR